MIQMVIEELAGLRALDGACHTATGWEARATRADAAKDALPGTWLGQLRLQWNDAGPVDRKE